MMQFQSIIFMASPQNIVTATHKKYDVHPGSLLPITAQLIVVTSNGLLYYYILSLVTDFLEELLLRFPSCQTQTFVLSWKKLPSQCAKNEKIVQWVGNEANQKASFSLFSSYCGSLWYFRITGRHYFWKSTWNFFLFILILW